MNQDDIQERKESDMTSRTEPFCSDMDELRVRCMLTKTEVISAPIYRILLHGKPLGTRWYDDFANKFYMRKMHTPSEVHQIKETGDIIYNANDPYLVWEEVTRDVFYSKEEPET